MLEACALECVRGHRRLFADLSFAVHPGDCFELRGRNGSGKTTLLRMLCGLLPPTAGAILWRGQPIHDIRETYLSMVAYVGHRHAVKDELTTMENLRLSSALSGFELRRDEARTLLRRFGLHLQETFPAGYLSAGQRRRLALARLMTGRRSVWLLDEVLTSLDDDGVESISTLIQEHLCAGGMAVIATHQDLPIGSRTLPRIELTA